LADFSGYIAADELYDGPFCVLSIVDNRTFKRLAYRVLDHDPTQDDITDFFQGFRAALDERGLAWIPTEGKLTNNRVQLVRLRPKGDHAATGNWVGVLLRIWTG
jgi:hypothetical protein